MNVRRMMLPIAALVGSLALLYPSAAQAETAQNRPPSPTPNPSFGDAYYHFMHGGSALGYGAAALVASAYTGVALTPELVVDSLRP